MDETGRRVVCVDLNGVLDDTRTLADVIAFRARWEIP